jgi:hypothetical protein
MRNAVQRRNHKERAQPLEREKWGLLEKRKVRHHAYGHFRVYTDNMRTGLQTTSSKPQREEAKAQAVETEGGGEESR